MGFPLPSNDPLGTDILLDDNGDIVVNTSGSIQMVSNQENVRQAIRVQLTTIPDLYFWDDSIGSNLSSYVDEHITSKIEKEITSIVTARVMEDTRILSVDQVNIDDSNPDTLIIFVTATTVSGDNLSIPISVASGGV